RLPHLRGVGAAGRARDPVAARRGIRPRRHPPLHRLPARRQQLQRGLPRLGRRVAAEDRRAGPRGRTARPGSPAPAGLAHPRARASGEAMPTPAPGALTDVTDETFAEIVLASDRLVVVDFWATWCRFCPAVSAALTSIAPELGDRVRFVALNYDDNPA